MENNSGFNFDFINYKKILSLLSKNFNTHLLGEAPFVLERDLKKPVAFLRHDVDLDLECALNFAEIDYKHSIKSCFMVIAGCPFYSIREKSNQKLLRYILNLGHEIGLHFDSGKTDGQLQDGINEKILQLIIDDLNLLEDIISNNINSISFHRPLKNLLKGPFYVAGRVNAYSLELMDWYISDSKQNWRDGNPLVQLERPAQNILQLLIHPIWWNHVHTDAGKILQHFYERNTSGISDDDKFKFDMALKRHLTISRTI